MTARASNVSRVVTGIGLLVSALLLLAWALLSLGLEFPGDARERLEEVAANRERMLAIALVFGVAQIALLPAVLGLVHLTRDRSFVLAHLGGALAVLGVLGHLVFTGNSIAGLAIAENGTGPEHVDLFESATSHAAVLPFLAVGAAGTFVGFLLLAGALWRSRTVPTWVPVVLAAGFLLEFVGTAVHELLAVAGAIAVTVAFGWLGVRVLRMTVHEWRAAPM